MDTWNKVMELKDKDTRHKGVANTLTNDEILTVLGVIVFFGGSIDQAVFDLKVARYRVFDFLGMCIGGRIDSIEATKVLVYSFLKADGDIDKWIEDLRVTDYDVDTKWQDLKLEDN